MTIKKDIWIFSFLGCMLCFFFIFYKAYKTKENVKEFYIKDNIYPISASVLTELDLTQNIVMSELLFQNFKHISKLVNAIKKAKAHLIILTQEPIEEKNITTWLKQFDLSPKNLPKFSAIPILHESYWVRDFIPIPTRYEPQVFDRYFLSDFRFRTEHSVDDTVSYQIALYLNLNLMYAPVVMDGGNFISNGKTCIVTAAVASENSSKNSLEEIKKIFTNFFGCQSFHILKHYPHEHVDMFVKFINRDTVLINELEISQENIKNISEHDLELSKKYKKQLDHIAKYFAPFFKVIRIPMPLITNEIFRTYANSLLVNNVAIIPSYKMDKTKDIPFFDQDLLIKYEKKIANIYSSFDYIPIFINSDDLIARGGSIHCVTAQLPANKRKLNRNI